MRPETSQLNYHDLLLVIGLLAGEEGGQRFSGHHHLTGQKFSALSSGRGVLIISKEEGSFLKTKSSEESGRVQNLKGHSIR